MIKYNMFDDTETQSNVYTAQDVAERMASFGDGVCGNDELKCSYTASQVTVSPGRAWIMGYFYESIPGNCKPGTGMDNGILL